MAYINSLRIRFDKLDSVLSTIKIVSPPHVNGQHELHTNQHEFHTTSESFVFFILKKENSIFGSLKSNVTFFLSCFFHNE